MKMLLLSLLAVGIILSGTQPCIAQQNKSAEKIQWFTIEQAIQLSKKEKRKILIDVYTDWCGWCKQMEKTTFQQPGIVQYMNQYYYPVRFNAEQKEDIIFNNKTYKYIRNGNMGYHELAAELLRGQLSYPTIVFLDEELNLIQAIPGYRDAATLELIMSYFGEDGYKNVPWTKYERDYKPRFVQPVKGGN